MSMRMKIIFLFDSFHFSPKQKVFERDIRKEDGLFVRDDFLCVSQRI